MERRPASDRRERERMRAALVGLRVRPGPIDLAVRLVVRAGFGLVGWRIRADGWELLPRNAAGRVVPCVVAVAPHRGWTDPFVLLLTWPRDAPRLAWFGDARTMTRSGWRRALLPRLGMVPIPAEATPAAVREHLADARLVLGRGCCLVVFPEKGPPSARGRTRTIAPGAAWLAGAGGVPLVPVAIGGFLEIGLGTRFRLRALAPLRVAPLPPDSATGRRAARGVTDLLGATLAPAVAELESWSARINGSRPLPGLRRLFR